MILSINAGSTSLKYQLFDKNLHPLASGEFSDCQIDEQIFKKIFREVSSYKLQVTSYRNKIVHRIVHGGPKYRDPIKITPAVVKEINKYNHLAPLHNPSQLKAIELAQKYFPGIGQYAVFDTGFYKDLSDKAKIYPLPLELYKKHKIQKLGFHGISHEFVLEQAKNQLKIKKPNIISLHLGGGSSVTAVKAGKAIDTSMGWTPMEGVMMWSRAGDVDLGIVLNFQSSIFNFQTNSKSQILNYWNKILNHESGLKGISGCQNYLDLLKKYKLGNKSAKLAIDMFVYRIQKYIGAYYAVLNGKVDAIAFTGKIGAGDSFTRNLIMKNLPFLCQIKKIIVKPNEELMIAKHIFNWQA